ncbi:MAG TPA: DUF1349 domain-containing protein [Candidatus Hydrogenedentes bacterium]|nr:DUF1349 domain-containing protein [Candidatus Hydrogenedentota bacterium]
MRWFNEPRRWRCDNGLEIITDRETDFWQRTHYGFCRDNGHCLFALRDADFALTVHACFQPRTQYDQCGIMIRADRENWIKLSTEYENEDLSRLGSVVTNLGYSDWATQDVASSATERWYRATRQGSDFLLESSEDGELWRQMRVTHLHHASTSLEAGVYACSPVGENFLCRFDFMRITETP